MPHQSILLQAGFYTINQALTLYEVCKDFILPILIAFSAGYMVYWAFVKETKRDREKELESEKQARRDKLTYFSNLVKNVISFSEQMNVIILDFVKAQRQEPTEVQQLLLFSLNEYRRITTDLQLEAYMLAYVNYYNGDRKVVIREFNNIVVRIDMLYGNYRKMEPHLEQVREDDRKVRSEFSSCQLMTSNLLVSLKTRLKVSAPQLSAELDEISFKLMRIGGIRLGLKTCYYHFFVPLNNFAIKYLNAEIAEAPMIQQLAMLTRDGKILFEQLVTSNRGLAEEFEGSHNSLETEVVKLKEFAKKLLEDFGG